MFQNADEVLKYIKDEKVEFIDVRFTDLPGVQQHFNLPASNFGPDAFTEGQMFDGSSIRGFASIHKSDLKLIPDPATAFVDPFRKAKTIAINHSIVEPRTGEPYERDPRQVAAKAEAYLKTTGVATTSYFGAEAEFYIFDEVRYESGMNGSFYKVDSDEGAWNTGREEEGGNLGYKTGVKGGYFPVPPYDHQADLRDEMSTALINAGFELERAHHEVGTGGQAEINYKFNTLTHAADELLLFKYIIKNVAWRNGKSATFMPKPLFYDELGYAGLSDVARYYVGGLLHHAPSLLAFTNPTVNSYHRLVPGYEAPVNLVYSAGNRSACIRVPITGTSPKAKRIEFRVPDPSANPYLAFAAMMMAGLDGIKNKIEPATPVDKDLYELPPDEAKAIPQVPGSLSAVLDNLEDDHSYLTQGGVFTEDLIAAWIDYKRVNEVDPVRLRPHPYEFDLYYNI